MVMSGSGVVSDYKWLPVVMGGSGVVMCVTSDYKWLQVVLGGYGVALVGFGWLQVVSSGYGYRSSIVK